MAGIFHTQVALYGYDFPDFQLTCALNSAIVAADVGKALAQDTAGANRVKLAGEGDEIIGYLMTFEDRVVEGQKVGTVSFKFAQKLKIKTGETVAVGDRLVGAGSGEVKALAQPANEGSPSGAGVTAAAVAAAKRATAPIVFAVADGYATALKL
ncbi:MAG: hypothetical protein ACK4FG_01855 [Brevundimonas sp.]